MAKGKNQKPSYVKVGETPRNNESNTDELSTVDLGADFVKAGEQPRRNQ